MLKKGMYKKHAVMEGLLERRSEPRKQVDQYHHVEFLSGGIEPIYQLMVRTKSSKSVDLLIEEQSEILQQLKLGDTLKMIYCPIHSAYPRVYLETVIRHITKIDRGRFSGHYLIGLERLKRQE